MNAFEVKKNVGELLTLALLIRHREGGSLRARERRGSPVTAKNPRSAIGPKTLTTRPYPAATTSVIVKTIKAAG